MSNNKQTESTPYEPIEMLAKNFWELKENEIYHADEIQTKDAVYKDIHFFIQKDFIIVFEEWLDTVVINKNILETIKNVSKEKPWGWT